MKPLRREFDTDQRRLNRMAARRIFLSLLYPDRRSIDRASQMMSVPRYELVLSLVAGHLSDPAGARLALKRFIKAEGRA